MSLLLALLLSMLEWSLFVSGACGDRSSWCNVSSSRVARIQDSASAVQRLTPVRWTTSKPNLESRRGQRTSLPVLPAKFRSYFN